MKTIFSLITIVAWALLASCATPAQSKFSAETMATVKAGMSKSEITALLGEPRTRSVESDGTESWQYRKNGQQGKGIKKYSDIVSFGLTSSLDSEYQDVLTVRFKDGIVLNSTYQENVHLLLTK